MAHEVVFAPEAQADLLELYDYIAERAGAERALGYLERIKVYCFGFANLPERGMRHDNIRPGLRTIGFERRITIAFHLTPSTVTIDRILYGGRDIATAFSDDGT